MRGTVVSLPLIDVPAFLPRSPFVCPIDGKNPNRFFPGNPDGTFSEVMDDAIFRAVIAPADVLIDLHGGDMVEALVPFSIYSVSGNEEVDARSVALGEPSGCPTSSRHDRSRAASAAPRPMPRRRRGSPASSPRPAAPGS